MWSLLPCYCWRSWACLYYNPRFNTAFQCGSSFSWGLLRVIVLHLSHSRIEASEMANSLSDGFIMLMSSRDRLRDDHPTPTWLGASLAALEGLQWNSMSKSNKHEQRTSAKHQKPNPLHWETTTVDTAAYGQDTALQQGQIMIDVSSGLLYTQIRLYSQEKHHNSQMSK